MCNYECDRKCGRLFFIRGGSLCSDEKTDKFLQISITDEGSGFTSEALHHAQDQFLWGIKAEPLI